MAWTEAQKAEFVAAGDEAEQELRVALEKGEIKTAQDIMQFHQRWFMRAGHKRLGRLYNELAV
jgi:hypothetical protein